MLTKNELIPKTTFETIYLYFWLFQKETGKPTVGVCEVSINSNIAHIPHKVWYILGDDMEYERIDKDYFIGPKISLDPLVTETMKQRSAAFMKEKQERENDPN